MSLAARMSLSCPSRQNAFTWLADESGAIAVEYGLLVALIALAVLGTIIQLGDALFGLPLQLLVDAFDAAVS
jgi:Flp pilus assembly pilin Flp